MIARGPRWRALCLAGTGVVLALTGAALTRGVFDAEAALRAVLLAWASPGVLEAARWVSEAGTWRGLVPGALVLLALSSSARSRWWLWGAALVVAPLLGEGLQELAGRRRPHGVALGFPSGHATSAAAFAVTAVYLAGRTRLRGAARLGLRALAVAGMLAVGLARVLLGAHWPGDVIGGIALGSACAAAAAWWDASHPPPADRPPAAMGVRS